MSLPTADDLFRPTVVPDPGQIERPTRRQAADGADGADVAASAEAAEPPQSDAKRSRTASGRVRHDEKMTVYITSEELLDLEHARLMLRRDQGLAVDRGRLVRTAVALVLAEYEAQGDDSALVQRLTQE